MSQKFFNHTVQPLGSTTSPVEDLAVEVDEAFSKIAQVLDTSSTTMVSMKDTIGNSLLQSLNPHGVTKTISESFTVLPNQTDIVLSNEPADGTLSVSYIDIDTGAPVAMSKIQFSEDFTLKDQFKVVGKVLRLNIRVPEGSSKTINAEYTSTTFKLNDKKFLSNVFKKEDESFLITPVQDGNRYYLDYQRDLENNLDQYLNNTQDTLYIFYTEDGDNFNKVDVDSFTIEGNKVYFTSDHFTINPNTKAITYVANTTIAQLLDALYKEFLTHNHSNTGLTANVDSYSVINRTKNTDKINYKDNDIDNYQYPQYLNREGYNSNLDAVYENSFLGDLFLARVISDSVQKYKGLDADSNSLMFGDPILGPKIKYSNADNGLVLDALGNVNGLIIKTNSDEKYPLKLNGSTFVSNSGDKLSIHPEGNELRVLSKDSNSPYTLKYDNSESLGLSTLKNIKSTSIKVGDTELKVTDDNRTILGISDNATDPKNSLYVTIPTNISKLNVDQLTSPNDVRFNRMNTQQIIFGEVTTSSSANGVVVTSTKASDKIVYNIPVEFSEVRINSLASTTVNPDKVRIGDVVLMPNEDPVDNGLIVTSTNPTSSIKFTSKTDFTEIEADKVISPLAELTTISTDNLGIGDVLFRKDAEGNIHVNNGTSDKRIIFESPIQMVEVSSQLDGKVDLDKVKSKLISIGNISFEKQEDGNVKLLSKDGGKLIAESELVANVLTPISIDGKDATGYLKQVGVGTLNLGKATFTQVEDQLHLLPKSVADDKLVIGIKTEINKAKVAELEVANATVTNTRADIVNIGRSSFQKDEEGNTQVVPLNEDAKLNIVTRTVINNLKANSLQAISSNLEQAIAKNLNIAQISLREDENNKNLEILSQDLDAEVIVRAKTTIDDLLVNNSLKVEAATLEQLKLSTLKMLGFTLSKEEGSNNIILVSDVDSNALVVNSKLVSKDFSATKFRADEYKLYNRDKITIDSNNYLANIQGRITFVNEKFTGFIGSGINSGIALAISEVAPPTFKQYIASNAGSSAIEAEKNIFIEADVSDGVYFLKPTNKKLTKNSVVYGFNDTTAQKNISDLRAWFRSSIFVDRVNANAINLAVNEPGKKNGIAIGETKISVIGPDTECPAGLTIFESADDIHFVRPLAADNQGCSNLTYQAINVGGATVNGEVNVDGSLSVNDSLIVNDTIASTNLTISERSELKDVEVLGKVVIRDGLKILNELDVGRDVTLAGDIKSKGDATFKAIETTGNVLMNKDLEVKGTVNIVEDLHLEGKLSLGAGVTSEGVVKSVKVESTELATHNAKLSGDLNVSGTSIVQGQSEIKGKLLVANKVLFDNSLDVREDITARTMTIIEDANINGMLRSTNMVELSGRSVVIGSDSSTVQVNGKLHFNTTNVHLNSPVSIFNKLRVTDDVETTGEFISRGIFTAESAVKLNGTLTSSGSIETVAGITAKNAKIEQNLEVGSSVTADNFSAKSIGIDDKASISNLTITKSLSMPIDTSIVAGDLKINSLNQTNPNSDNYFSGALTVARPAEFLDDVTINDSLVLGGGEIVFNSLGVKAPEARIDIGDIKANEIRGKERIQPPSALASSKNGSAQAISGLISQREFLRLDHIVSEGVSVFNQPIVADTIFCQDIVYIGEGDDKGYVNITSKKALYG